MARTSDRSHSTKFLHHKITLLSKPAPLRVHLNVRIASRV